jgi:ATP-dependent exoDNAse (exonuclease V) alpha subunit
VEVVHPDSLEDYKNLLESFDAEALRTEGRKERKKIWLQKAELMDTFMSIKYAPFITGHKSQGSEYPVVIIDLKDVMRVNVPFVLNRLLYVMISRAKQHLIFMI